MNLAYQRNSEVSFSICFKYHFLFHFLKVWKSQKQKFRILLRILYLKMNYLGEMLKCMLFLSDEYHRTIADSSNMTLLINKDCFLKNDL